MAKLKRNELVEIIREVLMEESAYQAFFNKAAAKFGVAPDKIDELPDEKKKEFYNYLDNNWKSKDEEMEETLEFPEFSKKGMDRMKAQKRKQILKKPEVQESKEATIKKKVNEDRIRAIIREELTFLMFNEVPATKSLKRAKRTKKLSGNVDLP